MVVGDWQIMVCTRLFVVSLLTVKKKYVNINYI